MTEPVVTKVGATITALLQMVDDGRGESVEAAIADLDTRFSDEGAWPDPFRLWALARQLDCYAVALDMPVRKARKGRVERGWQAIVARMELLRGEIAKKFSFSTGLLSADLSQLTTYSTRKSGKYPFYASMTLFLINAMETEPVTGLAMKALLPTSERDMLSAIVDVWLEPLKRGEAPSAIHPDADQDTSTVEQIAMSWPINEWPLEDFERFFKKFAVADDGCAHFICYRNGSQRPERLVRSFLVIEPPSPGGVSYTFSHYYEVPKLGDQSRVSRGHVVPLAGGLYLIGGQRSLSDEVPSDPADSLEVIAFPWPDVDIRESLLRALTLSSNYVNELIAGRMAVRATPISKYSLLSKPLDGVEADHILPTLQSDIRDESKAGRAPFTRVAANVQLEKILSFTNNVADHELALTFRPTGQEGGKALDVEQMLDETFGTEDDPRFVADEVKGLKFVFWRDLRFGPLSQDS